MQNLLLLSAVYFPLFILVPVVPVAYACQSYNVSRRGEEDQAVSNMRSNVWEIHETVEAYTFQKGDDLFGLLG